MITMSNPEKGMQPESPGSARDKTERLRPATIITLNCRSPGPCPY